MVEKKKIVIFTGNELRHLYFCRSMENDKRFVVVHTYCEGNNQSLGQRIKANPNASSIEIQHYLARKQSEHDFFGDFVDQLKFSEKTSFIQPGDINSSQVIETVKSINPDLIICYGTSLIKSELLDLFSGRFLNVHLGLSPYYRGSGTNVWPMINRELEYVGATFMYIDAGIDTGNIIHQIRPKIFVGDSPHSIGNRTIRMMVKCYADLISSFDSLKIKQQPVNQGKLYFRKDFDAVACEQLYLNFKKGLVEDYLAASTRKKMPKIIENETLIQ